MSNRILMIEDEAGILKAVKDRLIAEGYDFDFARDGQTGLIKALEDKADVILLDIMMPNKNGYQVLAELRRQGIQTPVIMLTAKSQTMDKVSGLRTGANDYLTKPFDFDELLARIEVQLRDESTSSEKDHLEAWFDLSRPDFRFGPFLLRYSQGALFRDGERVSLSFQEFKLLCYLIYRKDQLVDNDELLSRVWGYDAEVPSRTLYVHIAWLRKKIKCRENPSGYIKTRRGLGYLFETV